MRLAAPLLCASLAGCLVEFPETPPGNVIRGEIAYSGTEASGLIRPALRVGAYVDFPPTGPPYSARVIEGPAFDRGTIAYELRDLPPFRYLILAQIFDLANPDDLEGVAGGAYRTYCDTVGGGGHVEVTADGPVENIDLTVYDLKGLADPCFAAGGMGPCPVGQNAGMELTVTADGQTPGESDSLLVALFTSWPPSGFPVRNQALQGISFPYVVTDNGVPAGEYFVYVCFDFGSDNGLRTCTPPDLSLVYGDVTRVRFEAGRVTRLETDVSRELSAPPRLILPPEAGCP